jgi:hypothetical protein
MDDSVVFDLCRGPGTVAQAVVCVCCVCCVCSRARGRRATARAWNAALNGKKKTQHKGSTSTHYAAHARSAGAPRRASSARPQHALSTQQCTRRPARHNASRRSIGHSSHLTYSRLTSHASLNDHSLTDHRSLINHRSLTNITHCPLPLRAPTGCGGPPAHPRPPSLSPSVRYCRRPVPPRGAMANWPVNEWPMRARSANASE